VDYNVTRKEFKFAAKHNLPFFFVSAADGTNVVKVFESAILEAKRFKESGGDFLSNLLETLEGGEVTLSLTLTVHSCHLTKITMKLIISKNSVLNFCLSYSLPDTINDTNGGL
jgi:hypothetical protein